MASAATNFALRPRGVAADQKIFFIKAQLLPRPPHSSSSAARLVVRVDRTDRIDRTDRTNCMDQRRVGWHGGVRWRDGVCIDVQDVPRCTTAYHGVPRRTTVYHRCSRREVGLSAPRKKKQNSRFERANTVPSDFAVCAPRAKTCFLCFYGEKMHGRTRDVTLLYRKNSVYMKRLEK